MGCSHYRIGAGAGFCMAGVRQTMGTVESICRRQRKCICNHIFAVCRAADLGGAGAPGIALAGVLAYVLRGLGFVVQILPDQAIKTICAGRNDGSQSVSHIKSNYSSDHFVGLLKKF